MFSLRRFLFSLCMYYATASLLYCQSESCIPIYTVQEVSLIAEEKYGLDDLLFNGVEYFAENVRANGNPDFEWDKSLKTSLFIKGHAYDNTNLHYDIVLDQLILTNVQKNFVEHKILLNSSFVDSFSLGDHLFINLIDTNENSENRGYFEKIFGGKSMFLKKYTKSFVDTYDLRNRHGKFSPQSSTCFIYNQGILIKVNSKKKLLSFYISHKKQIREFLRKNKIRYKKASNSNLLKLMTYCDDISTQIN